MSTVKEAVEVAVPLSKAYDQWTQFEEFPCFMEGVEEVRQLDDRHNHWTTTIGGVRREFNTEIVDQLQDDLITWRTVDGDTQQRGTVRLRAAGRDPHPGGADDGRLVHRRRREGRGRAGRHQPPGDG